MSVVAIDGPAGSGKSTVARGVARALDWRYVDTGAVYRGLTLDALRGGVDPRSATGQAVADRALATLAAARLRLGTDPQRPEVWLGEEDVTAEVRSAAVTGAVSALSAVPEIRRAAVELQRRLAGDGECVVEGRDVGTTVLPRAAVKIFLDADSAERARRRATQPDPGITAPGSSVLAAVAADLERRDRLDSERRVSPLRAAGDAIHLDTTSLTAADVIERVVDLARAAGLATGGAVPRATQRAT